SCAPRVRVRGSTDAPRMWLVVVSPLTLHPGRTAGARGGVSAWREVRGAATGTRSPGRSASQARPRRRSVVIIIIVIVVVALPLAVVPFADVVAAAVGQGTLDEGGTAAARRAGGRGGGVGSVSLDGLGAGLPRLAGLTGDGIAGLPTHGAARRRRA